MGRRSINTTKSGKYMNPTDQARKEARKRELKKNKKQRTMVRMAVLKGKDPLKLIEEMDAIDEMEYDPTAPPKLSERVLKDKRKKLKETFDRVFSMYEKEDAEYSMELRRQEHEYEKRHNQRIQHYTQVKNAEQVQLDQIPLPDMPIMPPPMTSQIPLPTGEIPLPHMMDDDDSQPRSILKKQSAYERPDEVSEPVELRMPRRKPPGPPPGTPPHLSDAEDDMETDPVAIPMDPSAIPTPPGGPPDMTAVPPPPMPDGEPPSLSKPRKIRFQDASDSDEDDKDTRLKYKHPPANVSALQAKMLKLAGQQMPREEGNKKNDDEEEEGSRKNDLEKDRDRDRDRDWERDRDREKRRRERREREREEDEERRRRRRRRRSDSDDSDSDKEEEKKMKAMPAPTAAAATVPTTTTPTPPGPPPGLPPGPPPGLPPMMFRPPPLRPPGAPPRMLPPGPPPGRPPGMPPGPPPGLPPNMRGMPPRLPPGPPGGPPQRMMRPPGHPGGPHRLVNPNVLSAPPSIMKPVGKQGGEEKKNMATIEAKPKIKNWKGDVTRFMPTSLKIKREIKDSKGRIIKPAAPIDETATVKANPTVQAKTKDDAYDTFMKEMEGLL